MSHWLDNTLQHLQVGEALIQGWQAPAADVIGRLHAGAERWQAAIRQMHATVNATVNLVDILRARTFL
jgi:predicted amino acid racemase